MPRLYEGNVIGNEKKHQQICMHVAATLPSLRRFWAMSYDSAHVMWMLRGPFLVQMEAIGQEPKCVSVVSCSPSPLRLRQFLAISTGTPPRRWDPRGQSWSGEAVCEGERDVRQVWRPPRNIAGFAPATCISLGYAAPYPCHPLGPPMHIIVCQLSKIVMWHWI